MSAPLVCRICLRSGLEKNMNIDERLTDLHDEMCDFDVSPKPTLSFCPLCLHQLKKFYNFKQKCRRTHKLLKKNMSELRKIDGIERLRKLLPPDPIGFSVETNKRGVFSFTHDSNLAPLTLLLQTKSHTVFEYKPNVAKNTDTLLDVMKTEVLDDKTEAPVLDEPMIKQEDGITEYEEEILIIENLVSEHTEFESLKTESNDVMDNDSDDSENFLSNFNIDEEIEELNDLKENIDDEDSMKIGENNEQMKISLQCNKRLLEIPQDDLKEFININAKANCDNNDTANTGINKSNEKNLKRKKSLLARNLKKIQDKIDLKNIKITSLPNTVDALSINDLKFIRRLMPKSEKGNINLKIKIMEFKERVVQLIENGSLDLGDNVTLTKEMFLDMFEKFDKTRLPSLGMVRKKSSDIAEIKKFLHYLLKKFNPEFETMFDIKYLNTKELKIAEYQSRKDSKEYLSAQFKCDKCYRGFEMKNLLNYHSKWHDVCTLSWSRVDPDGYQSLPVTTTACKPVETSGKYKPKRPYACEICSMRYNAKRHLNVHTRTAHYSVFQCKLCPVVTHVFSVMENHYHQHKGVQYTCDICLGVYSSKSSLNSHRLLHASHSCAHCARRFVSEAGLNVHVKHKHADAAQSEEQGHSQRVACDKCDATFKSLDVLQRHTRLVHDRGNLYKCGHISCEEKFPSAAALRLHARAQGHARSVPRRPRRARSDAEPPRARPAPYQPYKTCPICNEQVMNSASVSLYRHHVEHHPGEPYTYSTRRGFLCELCGKSFQSPGLYREHVAGHAGLRPHACAKCGARFALRRTLYAHFLQHAPPALACPDCGKMFRTPANLYAHRRIHIGDRRFKCDICFKGFLHPSSLREHVNGVHNKIRKVKKPVRNRHKK